MVTKWLAGGQKMRFSLYYLLCSRLAHMVTKWLPGGQKMIENYYITRNNMIENFLVVLIKVKQQQTIHVAMASSYKPTIEHVH
jgi:hypothetical protein